MSVYKKKKRRIAQPWRPEAFRDTERVVNAGFRADWNFNEILRHRARAKHPFLAPEMFVRSLNSSPRACRLDASLTTINEIAIGGGA